MAQKFMDEHSATISRDQDSPDDDRVLGKQNSYLLPTCATAPLPDHVRRENFELGFPADGYNYLVHLRDTKVGLFPVDAMAYDASAVSVQNVKANIHEEGADKKVCEGQRLTSSSSILRLSDTSVSRDDYFLKIYRPFCK